MNHVTLYVVGYCGSRISYVFILGAYLYICFVDDATTYICSKGTSSKQDERSPCLGL